MIRTAAVTCRQSDGLKTAIRSALAVLMVVFVGAAFFSKAALNISGGALLVLSIAWVGLYDHQFFARNVYLKYLLWVIGCGTVLAFFSKSGGLSAVGTYLNNTKFLVIPFPLAVAAQDRRWVRIGYGVLLGSCLLSMAYGAFEHGALTYGLSNGRIPVGRYADQLMVVALALIVFVSDVFVKKSVDLWARLGLSLLSAFLCFGLILSSQRGSWVGFVLGLLVFAVLNRKHFKMIALVGAVVLLVSVLVGGRFFQEVKTIGDITRDMSNITRLHLWATGFDFSLEAPVLGHGGDKIKEDFRTFYYAQPTAYQERYNKAISLAGNFHNSYLQIIAESGWVYFILLAGYFFWVTRDVFLSIARKGSPFDTPIQIMAVVTPGFLVSQFFHGDLFSYGGVAYMIVLSLGLRSWAMSQDG